MKISILDADSVLIREFSSDAKEKQDKLEIKEGANLFTWNMLYPNAEKFEKIILWWGSLTRSKSGPRQIQSKT